MKKISMKNDGFTFIEVLLTLTVMTALSSSLYLVFNGGLKNLCKIIFSTNEINEIHRTDEGIRRIISNARFHLWQKNIDLQQIKNQLGAYNVDSVTFYDEERNLIRVVWKNKGKTFETIEHTASYFLYENEV